MKTKTLLSIALAAAFTVLFIGCKPSSTDTAPAGPAPENVLAPEPPAIAENIEPGKRGGRLVIASLGNGPKTFNPTTANENSSTEIHRFLFAKLAWFDWISQEAKPGLAYEWSVAGDQRTWTWKLRKNLRWSDGAPLTADDVVFTWNDIIYNPDIVNVTADAFTIDGQQFKVTKVDDHTVQVVTPTIFAPFVEFVGDVEIMPKHILAAAVREKRYESAYGIDTPPEQIVGSGPFRLTQFKAGEIAVLERNPYYHRADANGTRLPYVDNLVFVFTPDLNALSLRFLKGESSFHESVRPDEFDTFKKEADAGKFDLFELGTGPEKAFIWFNLNTNQLARLKVTSSGAPVDLNWNKTGLGKTPVDRALAIGDVQLVVTHQGRRQTNTVRLLPGRSLPMSVEFDAAKIQIADAGGAIALAAKPVVEPRKLAWFRNTKFRQAISHAVDRPSIIKSIYAGRAGINFSYEPPANKRWTNPDVQQYDYNLPKAKALLKEIGIEDRDGDGMLEDREGHPIEFILNTNTGNSVREKTAVIVQEDFKRLGIKLIFQPVDFNALVDKIDVSFNYDCILLGLGGGFLDPAANSNVLKSDGFTHMWFPRQMQPSFPWEARIDELMSRQVKALDYAERKKLVDEIQAILAREIPFIFTVQPNIYTASRKGLGNLKPTAMYGFRMTWNAEEIFVK